MNTQSRIQSVGDSLCSPVSKLTHIYRCPCAPHPIFGKIKGSRALHLPSDLPELAPLTEAFAVNFVAIVVEHPIEQTDDDRSSSPLATERPLLRR
uniref:Uncharacterized protein n=1 Tax=Triticum urartu TaxID=4572 RepID=A0A8R7QZ92_TRIUA